MIFKSNDKNNVQEMIVIAMQSPVIIGNKQYFTANDGQRYVRYFDKVESNHGEWLKEED